MNDRWRHDESRRWAEPDPWRRQEGGRSRAGRYGADDPDAGWSAGREEGRSFRPAAWPRDEEQRAYARYAGGYGESGRGYGGRDEGGYGLDWGRDRERRRGGFTGFAGYGSDRAPDYYGAGRHETEDYGYSYGPDRDYARDREARHGGAYGEWRHRTGDRDWWDRTRDEVASWFGDDRAERRRELDHRRGEHHGRGPKGYVRSDDRIREDVNDRLTYDGWLDASSIDVLVDKAEVTLTGTVASRSDKRRAEDLAESISGVKHVQNNLRVETPSDTAGQTAATARGSSTGRTM